MFFGFAVDVLMDFGDGRRASVPVARRTAIGGGVSTFIYAAEAWCRGRAPVFVEQVLGSGLGVLRGNNMMAMPVLLGKGDRNKRALEGTEAKPSVPEVKVINLREGEGLFIFFGGVFNLSAESGPERAVLVGSSRVTGEDEVPGT